MGIKLSKGVLRINGTAIIAMRIIAFDKNEEDSTISIMTEYHTFKINFKFKDDIDSTSNVLDTILHINAGSIE